jgi:hypothetical protein
MRIAGRRVDLAERIEVRNPYNGELVGSVPGARPEHVRYLATHASGQLAFAAYRLEPAAGAHLPIALDVLSLRGDLIADVTAFRMPEAFARFGLPEQLPGR